AVRDGRQRVRDVTRRGIADAQLVLVDVGVVDPVDRTLAQFVVVRLDVAVPVPEAERFEEVLIDDDRAGRHDRVDHVRLDELEDHTLEPRADERARETQPHAALPIAEHLLVDPGRAGGVAGLERHARHPVDERDGIEGRERDVLDRLLLPVLRNRHFAFTCNVRVRFCLLRTMSSRAGIPSSGAGCPSPNSDIISASAGRSISNRASTPLSRASAGIRSASTSSISALTVASGSVPNPVITRLSPATAENTRTIPSSTNGTAEGSSNSTTVRETATSPCSNA